MADRIFVPFGELRPDGKLFNNDGLTRAEGVIPLAGNYSVAGLWSDQTGDLGEVPLGMHVHPTAGNSFRAYYGTQTKLKEVTPGGGGWTVNDKSRTVGGAYTAVTTSGFYGWQGASFGDAIVMTNGVDDPQLLTSPATANFVKLAQSGSGNPGMDPLAKFAWPVRNNLFLANLTLAAAFDGLPIGANPTVVAWSQTDNVRQYGSYNATPQLTGTGYQPLSYDLGNIIGGVGGEYALVALQQGWVRADGPPYTFRVLQRGSACRYPNSIVRFDSDVYFMGPAGPMKLPGGEGPAVPIGLGRVARQVTDAASGFGSTYAIYGSARPVYVSGAADSVTRSIIWAYTSTGASSVPANGNLLLIYSIDDDRFSFIEPQIYYPSTLSAAGAQFIGARPDNADPWSWGRDLVAVVNYNNGGLNGYRIGVPITGVAGVTLSTVMERAYQQLSPEATTRIQRVRPILSMADTSKSLTFSVTIRSKNSPYADATTFGPFSTKDPMGWVVTPTTSFADFHQISISTTTESTLLEMEGFEVEYVTGPAYGA